MLSGRQGRLCRQQHVRVDKVRGWGQEIAQCRDTNDGLARANTPKLGASSATEDQDTIAVEGCAVPVSFTQRSDRAGRLMEIAGF
jgi:hypothetical protein